MSEQYAAAKAGVLGQTRTDAIAYARDGIRINAVMPGSILTPSEFPLPLAQPHSRHES